MNSDWLRAVPEALQEKTRSAIVATFANRPVRSIQAVPGGASGALTYRIEAGEGIYLLRIETHRSPLRNPHQYECMTAAAEAGVAPPVRYADDGAGIAILDFIGTQPLEDFPGGVLALAHAMGELTGRLQKTGPFPRLADFRVVVERMLSHLQRFFAPGLLQPHLEGLELIKQSLRWDEAEHRSSHNDPGPQNVLFDGTRLWFIDWETAYRNDPLVDIAIVSETFARTPELETALLTAWRGKAPDKQLLARLLLMRQLTRLYYAGLLLTSAGKGAEGFLVTDLVAPSPEEFRSLVANGSFIPGAGQTKRVLGKMFLAGFLAQLPTPAFKEAIALSRGL